MNALGAFLRQLKRVPRWLCLVLAALLLLLAAALVVPYFLDVDRYRTLVASLLESRTGRKVSIGKIRARLLPRVGFVLEDFRLGNPSGFAEGNVLAVEMIRGNLAWRSLLRRQFAMDSVELVRPKLWLLEDHQGRTNYSWSARRNLAAGEPRRAPSSDSGEGLRPTELRKVILTDAQVVLGQVTDRDFAIVPSLRAQKVTVELRRVTLEPLEPKRWEGEARLKGVVLELAGWKMPIELRSGGLSLREGRIEAEFRAGMGKVAEWKVGVRVADIERAAPTFEFSTAQLDVDELLAGRADTSAAARRRRREHPGKSELVAHGRLAAGRLLRQPYATGNAIAEMRIFDDRTELWPVTVELYGGTLQISARSDRTQWPERFSANIQVRNLDVGRMLAAASEGRAPRLSGRGELDLQLFGSLDAGWRKSLSGTGRFAVHDGRLAGTNLAGVLGLLARVAGVGGDTPFSLIRGDLVVRESRVRSRLIHMDSPRGTVDLHGSFGLDGGLDYAGTAVLETSLGVRGSAGQNAMDGLAAILGAIGKDARTRTSRVTVPFTLRGTFDNPQLRPDGGAGGFASSPLAEPLNRRQPKKQPSPLDLFRRP